MAARAAVASGVERSGETTHDPAVIERFTRRFAGVMVSAMGLETTVSPVSYLADSTSLLLTVCAKLKLGVLLESFAPYGFLDGSKGFSDLERFLCTVTLGVLCKVGVDTVCGTSSADSSAMIERLTSHFTNMALEAAFRPSRACSPFF